MSTENIKNLVVVSDLHCGCRLGLCPPVEIPLDDGGYYKASELQNKVWQWWVEFWEEWVPLVTKGEPFAVVINGDSIDGVHHNSVTQISHNLVDQRGIAKIILEPVVKQCGGHFYMIRGTEAHVEKSGQSEEVLAKELSAIPNEDGKYARWDMWVNVGETGLVHILHHISTTGSLAYETTAVMKEYTEACSDAGRWNREAPQILVRSHRHRSSKIEVPIQEGYGICIVTPGWQLKTPLAWRIPGARLSTPQFGGIIIKAGDEDALYTRTKIWNISRTPTVRL